MFFLAAIAVAATTAVAAAKSDEQTKEGIKNTEDAAYMGAVTKQINAYSEWPGSLPTGHH
jgi:hypothetical protein